MLGGLIISEKIVQPIINTAAFKWLVQDLFIMYIVFILYSLYLYCAVLINNLIIDVNHFRLTFATPLACAIFEQQRYVWNYFVKIS